MEQSQTHESLRYAIDPNYGFVESVNPQHIRQRIDKLYQELLDDLPERCKSAGNAHLFNLYRGEFVKHCNAMSDAYIKARLAAEAEFNSCSSSTL